MIDVTRIVAAEPVRRMARFQQVGDMWRFIALTTPDTGVPLFACLGVYGVAQRKRGCRNRTADSVFPTELLRSAAGLSVVEEVGFRKLSTRQPTGRSVFRPRFAFHVNRPETVPTAM
jgi:hypothetical protein